MPMPVIWCRDAQVGNSHHCLTQYKAAMQIMLQLRSLMIHMLQKRQLPAL